ncbi:MAG: tetratricopeptide repeat protein [Treponemataceae bacterium]
MDTKNPLESVFFITVPEGYTLAKGSFPIDTTIPLPVQCENVECKDFDAKTLSSEMIIAGILNVLAYDRKNQHIQYYRSLVNSLKPKIKVELTEAAILKAKNEDWDIAEQIFTALQGLDPEDIAITLNSALFFDQRAESYKRSGLFEDADAYDSIAFEYYKKAMSAEPPLPDAFFNGGFFFLKQKNYSRGKSCFDTYLTLTQNDNKKELSDNERYKRDRAQEIINDINRCNLEDELFKSAYEFIKNGEEEKGLEKIKEFLQKNPKVWNAWFMLGWALRRLERWQDGKDSFLQAIECGADNVDTFNEIAICCMELGQLDEAKKYLIQALNTDSENTKIISNLGFLEIKSGNTEQAKKYFQIVLEIDPKDVLAKETLKNL